MVQRVDVFERTVERAERLRQEEQLLKPMLHTGKAFLLFAGALTMLVGWFLYAWYIQLTQGLGVTGMRAPVGAVWGVYIANFVFFVGLAHGGIAIAAAIRLMNLHKFSSVARIGEVLTIISLMMAGLSITIDMGRPDRIFNIVQFWPVRVGSSSLSWDVTVIILYFTLSASYLWLTMRRDLARIVSRFPKLAIVYKLLLIGYTPDEDRKVDRMAWWLSIAICFLIVMLSGGVVAWIFGLLPSRPGWFSALAGPYFLTAAISSAIAAVIVVAAITRKLLRWHDHIKSEIFSGLGVFLGIITLFYIYLILAEQLTMNYAAPIAEFMVSEMLLTGEFAPLFWPMLIIGFLIPALILILPTIYPGFRSTTRTVLAAGIILFAFWIKRFLIVVPSLLRPLLPFPEGSYNPSWVEWSIIAGVFAMAALMFMGFLKLFPIVELGEGE
ncbi:MAG: polysulfide reductase NrfD [Chloroflexi bacterium]|nr:polysulfide reductase NrfD [Chloroflexota bacterium]